MDRNNSIDIIKGFLIILVFLGHIIPGSLEDSFVRHSIYSFHMPLFMAVSGFMLNFDALKNKPFGVFIKYLKRLIIPWILAVIVYYCLKCKMTDSELSLEGVKNSFKYFDYHLWYIPTLLFFVFATVALFYVIGNHRFWGIFFWASVIISVITKNNILKIDSSFLPMMLQPDVFKQNFRVYLLIFFALGGYLRSIFRSDSVVFKWFYQRRCVYFVLIILCVESVITFICKNTIVGNIVFYLANLSVCFLILADCYSDYLPKSKVIEFIGRNSLPVYLWHVVGIWVAKSIFTEGSLLYYCSSIAFFIILVLIIRLCKEKRIKLWIIGIT